MKHKNSNNQETTQLGVDNVISSVTTWTDQNKQIPEITKYDWGYASRYVLVKFDNGEIVSARLEGETEDNLFWYSPLFDDQIDDVTEWMDVPTSHEDVIPTSEVYDFVNWSSDKSYKRCANGEWIQIGTGDYKTIAKNTGELYQIFKTELSKVSLNNL